MNQKGTFMSNPFETPQFSGAPAGETRMRLRRVGVVSVAMFGGAAGLLAGLLVRGIIFLFSMLGVGVGPNGQNVAPLIGFGIGTIVLGPILYGILGFVGGMINAFVYNIVARMSGGIQVEFSRDN